MVKPTLEQVKEVFKKKNHVIFTDNRKDYNLNIFGIRSVHTKAGLFDDLLGVFWTKPDGTEEYKAWKATTDPSAYWLKKLGNVNGTAILVPNQYRSAYAVGYHKTYEALRQVKPVSVYRDWNRDIYLDTNVKIYTGLFGINIHRASAWYDLNEVGPYSAGCQVFRRNAAFQEFMAICRKARDLWGNGFTYTLIEEKDILDL